MGPRTAPASGEVAQKIRIVGVKRMVADDNTSLSKVRQVAQVVEDIIRRRSGDERVLDRDILAAHADLMPELGEKLHALRRVEQAEQRAVATSSSRDPVEVEVRGLGRELPRADWFPGYTILGEIHRGGQGVVYRAVQESTQREVAIKVMKEGPFADFAERARFDREVRVLGQLQHPNIVTIHDSGTSAGSQYFVMDYIRGQPLDEHTKGARFSVKETMQLFAKICDAVNASHLRGIMHRDLKPGNVRISADGEPHILDFGLAKMTVSDSEASLMTMTGVFVGSLPWASPEQAEAAPSRVDVRTDVYSLGIILYQMLTNEFPYEVVGTIRDVIGNILTSEPRRPSTLRKDIDDEVETIVLKCLSKERERRYQTADDLARDVRRYLAGEPIEAKRDSSLYLLRKAVRRYRIPVAVVTAFVVLLAASLVASVTLWRQAENAAAGERLQRRVADQKTEGARQAQSTAEREREVAERRLYRSLVLVAAEYVKRDHFSSAAKALDECPARLRHWEWGWLARLSDVRPLSFLEFVGAVRTVAFSPDGRSLACGGDVGRVEIWDLDREVPSKQLLSLGDSIVWSVAFSPEGDVLAVGRGNDLEPDPRAVELWDVRTGRQTGVAEHPDAIHALAFSRDGPYLATGCADGKARLWDRATGELIQTFAGHGSGVLFVGITFDGRFLITASGTNRAVDDTTAKVWELKTDQLPYTIDHVRWNQVALAPRDYRFACGLGDGSIIIVDAETKATVQKIAAGCGDLGAVAFRPDGRSLAAVSADNTVRVWDLENGQGPTILGEHEKPVLSLAFNHDGTCIAAGGYDAKVSLWDPVTPRPATTTVVDLGDAMPETIAFSSGGDKFAVGTVHHDKAFIQVHDTETGDTLWESDSHPAGVQVVCFHPDGRRVASSSEDGVIRVWDTASNAPAVEFLPTPGQDKATPIRARPLAISPDGAKLVGGVRDGPASVWDLETGQRIGEDLEDSQDGLLSVAFSHDGRLIAGARGYTVRFWEVDGGRLVGKVETRARRSIWTVAFSPDDQLLFAGSLYGECYVIDVDKHVVEETLHAHRDTMTSLAVSHDGRRLATAGDSTSIRIWDTDTWKEVLHLQDRERHVRWVAFSPDGRTLATAAHDGRVILRTAYAWDEQDDPGRSIRPLAQP